MLKLNFELREINLADITTLFAFTLPVTGTNDKVGSNGIFPNNPVQIIAETAGLSVQLAGQKMYGLKFIHNAANSPVIASAIKNVVIKLEIRVG